MGSPLTRNLRLRAVRHGMRLKAKSRNGCRAAIMDLKQLRRSASFQPTAAFIVWNAVPHRSPATRIPSISRTGPETMLKLPRPHPAPSTSRRRVR